MDAGAPRSRVKEDDMTDSARTLCDCPEPCGCYAEGYAAGKDNAYFEIEMAL